MHADSSGDREELLLAACLVREPSLAEGRTGLVVRGVEEFVDPGLGRAFDRLREIRATHPQLAAVGIRYNLDQGLHPHLDRALAAWDSEAEQRHPQLPACPDEVEVLAALVSRGARHRRFDTLIRAIAHHYRSGDNDRAAESVHELLDLVRTDDDQWVAANPYAEHAAEILRREMEVHGTGRGFPVHPELDVLLHQRADWQGELVLLGARTKVGKTALACWWASRLVGSAGTVAPESQVVFFCTEMTRAELLARIQQYLPDPEQIFSPTPLGRPRFLLFGKEFFARTGSDPDKRLAAFKAEIRRFAVANLRWSEQHGLPVADCWLAGVFVDYLTSMLAAGNDFTVCEEFIRGADTSLRVFDPGWFGLGGRQFTELAGLPSNVMVCEQVNARREPIPKVTTDLRTGQTHRPPLEPPAPTEVNGARSTFETASVFCMLARDHEGRIHPPEQAVLRVSGRSVATRQLPLRFVGGKFEFPGDPAPAHEQAAVDQVEEPSVDPAAEHAARLWLLPSYVVSPPATEHTDGTLVVAREMWVPLDPQVDGWQPDPLGP
ncbi:MULTISPECIES: DnaB-like helicase C-terminal domain-containing protein [unclassified Crossiella]|uniref:DnaB-like helicase C-terminal domain-containing protein n=1 Tax=unclassified Crossiella TaxID=2620835 RepID=UPI001FFF85FE|nr:MULTISPECIES: DnaB-like helicase C-terminal domain-containing protein [unclassified Crossiella]MCK2240654.1 hypothetical protein [Crossiella sp. S99.2]MCK2252895.1 hypothetical protein [Crossiella sp. S99.1]